MAKVSFCGSESHATSRELDMNSQSQVEELNTMKEKTIIQRCSMEHIDEYGRIYAAAFSGEPWNDPWKPEDAAIHVKELLESKQSYGLECRIEDRIAGFILGTSMLFHYGRTFEINDLAVDPAFQKRGIAKKLMEALMSELDKQGIVGVHLITAAEAFLPQFYERFGFQKEERVILMGKEME